MENAEKHNASGEAAEQDQACPMSEHKGPKHAKHAAPAQPTPEPPLTVKFAPSQAFMEQEQNGAGAKRFNKVPLIVVGIIVAVLVAVYFAGVFVFTGRFYPNTTAGTLNISLKTPTEVCMMMDDALADYEVQVRGQNVRLDLTSKDLALNMDSQAIAHEMMANMNPWAWPYEMFQQHNETKALVATYGSGELEKIVSAEVARINAKAVEPQNATIFYNDMRGRFDVVDEKPGTMVDPEAVAQQVAEGIMRFDRVVNLDEDVLVQPQLLVNDPRILSAQEQANDMVKANIPLMVNGEEALVLKGVTLADWISVSPEGDVTINEENLTNFMNKFIQEHNTVGAQRSYTRADGKNVTVKGGSYGWS